LENLLGQGEVGKHLLSELQTKLLNDFESYFWKYINSAEGASKSGMKKLRTYAKMKSTYKVEEYLNSKFPKHYLRSIASFMLSTHKLEIELVRYHKPKPTPPHERICTQCASGEVEDEIHLTFKCNKYPFLKCIFVKEIQDVGYTVSHYGNACLRDLFANEHPGFLFSIGKYITTCMKLKQ
jgi:hypothetical protein